MDACSSSPCQPENVKRKSLNYQRLFKPYAIAVTILGLAMLALEISRLTPVRLPEILVLCLFVFSGGFFATPVPRARAYFELGSPAAMLCILLFKELAGVPYVMAALVACFYRSKTTRRTTMLIILCDALKFAPILWISWFVYERLGGTDFHSLSELRILPFASMVLTAALLDYVGGNALRAMRMGKPPWSPVPSVALTIVTETDAFMAPLAIPMYLFYQSQGARGLFFLLFPFVILLIFVKFFVKQAYKKQQFMDALSVAGELIQSRLSLRGFMDRVFDRLAAIFDPAIVVDFFTANEGSGWKLMGHLGQSPWADRVPSPEFFEEAGGVLSKEPALFRDISEDKRFASYRAGGLVSLLIIPLLSDERNIGFVVCSHKIPRFFDEGHVELAKILAGPLSSALVSAQLHEHLEATLKELRETQTQLVQAEKLVGLSRLVAGVAHELNNPLNLLTLQLPLLWSDVEKLLDTVERQVYAARVFEEDEFRLAHRKEKLALQEARGRITKSFAALHEGTYRSKNIVDNLRAFARAETLGESWEYVDINEAIESTALFLTPLYEGRVALHKDYREVPKVWANPDHISKVFMNLLTNAFDAIEGKGDVWVKTSSTDGKLEVTVTDSGPGIPEAIRKRVFEPFFTTKEVGQGTGLGLSIVYGIMKQHRGEIQVESREGHGTTFRVMLPVASNAVPSVH